MRERLKVTRPRITGQARHRVLSAVWYCVKMIPPGWVKRTWGRCGADEAAWKKRGGRGPRNHGAEVGRELESGYFTLMVILAFWRNPATYSP